MRGRNKGITFIILLIKAIVLYLVSWATIEQTKRASYGFGVGFGQYDTFRKHKIIADLDAQVLTLLKLEPEVDISITNIYISLLVVKLSF